MKHESTAEVLNKSFDDVSKKRFFMETTEEHFDLADEEESFGEFVTSLANLLLGHEYKFVSDFS